MNTKPGSAKQTKKEQREHTAQVARTALGKLLLLKAGIAKNSEDKPIEVKLDANTALVIGSVLHDLAVVITNLSEAKPSQAEAKPKQKQKQKPSRLGNTKPTGVYNRHNQKWSEQ